MAALFFVWVSTFNVLIISVFWSLMADTFSRTQAKRLFGFIAAGGTVGTIGGPALAALLVNTVGTNTLMLISAGRLRRHGLAGARAGDRRSAASGTSGAEAQRDHARPHARRQSLSRASRCSSSRRIC